MGWNRYFVLQTGLGWMVAHNGLQTGAFPDKMTAASYALDRARKEPRDSRDPCVVLVQGQDSMFRELWSSVDPTAPRYTSAWIE